MFIMKPVEQKIRLRTLQDIKGPRFHHQGGAQRASHEINRFVEHSLRQVTDAIIGELIFAKRRL